MLLVRKGARWRNPFPADDRIDERAPGFENVPAALAAAAALQAVVAERDEVDARQRRAGRPDPRRRWPQIPDVEVVGDPVDRLPHLVTFSCLYVDGEALVTELDRRGFAVASGSACTASTLEPSHVLAAMGALTHGNVRVSLTRDTDRGRRRRLPGRAARASWRELRAEARPVTADRSSSTAAGMLCPLPVIELAKADRRGRGRRDRRACSPTTPPRPRDIPAWCRMRGQEYVGEEPAADGGAALPWCGGSAEST